MSDRYETIDGQTIIAVRLNDDMDADLYTKEGQFVSVNIYRDKIVGGLSTLTLEEAAEISETPLPLSEWIELRRP
jgi:hypothetical protein